MSYLQDIENNITLKFKTIRSFKEYKICSDLISTVSVRAMAERIETEIGQRIYCYADNIYKRFVLTTEDPNLNFNEFETRRKYTEVRL